MRYQDQVEVQIYQLEKAGFTPTDLYLGSREYYALRNTAHVTMHQVGVLTAWGLNVHIVGEDNHLMVAGRID